MKTVLLLATTTGYQTRLFGEAAERLGIALVLATDRCDQLDDPWWDGAIPVRFHHDATAADAIVTAGRDLRIDGWLAVGDRPTVAAAFAAERLGLPGHPPEAARAARDKRLTRERLRAAGLPTPQVTVVRRSDPSASLPDPPQWPVVVKPAALSGSRGVIRADTRGEMIAAFERVQRLLNAVDIRELRDPAAESVVIETFVAGREYALEGILHHGLLQTLAIFDKPDPLDGPFFEETIYLTPSRAAASIQADIMRAIARAAAAIGLWHGPVHAECRVNDAGVFVLEVAARPIGGLCAGALSFIDDRGQRASLEELLLRHAVGESVEGWRREPEASGVMMIPIPSAGVLRRVEGTAIAMEIPHVRDVRITAKPDQQLVPLPEGSSYLGFIFAKADTPAAVERALRDAHAALTFVIDRRVPVL